MLKKENRLVEIKKKTEKKISTPLFNLGLVKNGLDVSRFAFIITKKVDKRATVRNKTRRKVRSVIEEIFNKIEKGRDFIFYLKSGAVEATREEILSETNSTFLRNKLLK